MILLVGHRREVGRYDLLSFGFFFGFRMGTRMARFHMAGMVAVLTDLLKILQRNVMPAWAKCLRWSMVTWSRPFAVDFWLLLIASATPDGENGRSLGLICDFGESV